MADQCVEVAVASARVCDPCESGALESAYTRFPACCWRMVVPVVDVAALLKELYGNPEPELYSWVISEDESTRFQMPGSSMSPLQLVE